jgi:hypothetical protein
MTDNKLNPSVKKPRAPRHARSKPKIKSTVKTCDVPHPVISPNKISDANDTLAPKTPNLKTEPLPAPNNTVQETEQRAQKTKRILKQITEADPTIHEQIFKIILKKNPALQYSENGKEIFIRQTLVDNDTYAEIDGILNIYFQNKKYQIERNLASMNT